MGDEATGWWKDKDIYRKYKTSTDFDQHLAQYSFAIIWLSIAIPYFQK